MKLLDGRYLYGGFYVIDLSFVHIELMEELKRLEKDAGIYASALVTNDGFPLVTAMHNYVDEVIVSASSASMLALGERTTEEFRHGKLNRIIVEGKDGMTIINGLNKDLFLITLAPIDSRLGLLFLEIEETMGRIRKIIKKNKKKIEGDHN
ncbi:MAG: roadblock/LC7 domain-containing protein [Promethearchaeota archaeon]